MDGDFRADSRIERICPPKALVRIVPLYAPNRINTRAWFGCSVKCPQSRSAASISVNVAGISHHRSDGLSALTAFTTIRINQTMAPRSGARLTINIIQPLTSVASSSLLADFAVFALINRETTSCPSAHAALPVIKSWQPVEFWLETRNLNPS